MLSDHASRCRHAGQREAGNTIESRAGRRWMQTFRKLPTHSPPIAITISAKPGATASAGRLDLPGKGKELRLARHGDRTRRGVEPEPPPRRVEGDPREEPGRDQAIPRHHLS